MLSQFSAELLAAYHEFHACCAFSTACTIQGGKTAHNEQEQFAENGVALKCVCAELSAIFVRASVEAALA